ncbi:hypothetical protein [Mycobacterium talmoniae]|nr:MULTISPECIES: hypothetical protein [Mycobacterium]
MTDSSDERPVIAPATRRVNPVRVLAYGVAPALVLLLAMAAGWLKWQDQASRSSDLMRAESTDAAIDSTVAMLSYSPDTVDSDVAAARALTTDGFRDTYLQLAHDQVVPNAKERHISETVSVPGAAAVSVSVNHAVVLVFADRTMVTDSSPPVEVPASYRVTLDKVGGRWLVAGFDPV